MLRPLIALILILTSWTSFGSERAELAWQQIRQQEAVIIDVRSPGEFAEGRLKGAINIPHDIIADEMPHLSLAKDQPIVVYCRSGRRSGIAEMILEKQGYTKVTNGGGLNEMLAAER
ncbi:MULTISPECIES: rhodanese-like domain-containing protein [Ferrimonas]|uniref:rhodanese-like domain-containing protein n=1 Tax=Ferrimonas TaxID=44011 RepID=UPI0004078E80|nr:MULTISPECIES: rhodanese-like domain-containing protein [Ferrimonas]USD36693.1 rhodanese-like domain-containing protein [Ferrimonas sp. SCSIO 43195]